MVNRGIWKIFLGEPWNLAKCATEFVKICCGKPWTRSLLLSGTEEYSEWSSTNEKFYCGTLSKQVTMRHLAPGCLFFSWHLHSVNACQTKSVLTYVCRFNTQMFASLCVAAKRNKRYIKKSYVSAGGETTCPLPPPKAVWLVADLHPSADGSTVCRTSVVAGKLQAASSCAMQPACYSVGSDRETDR